MRLDTAYYDMTSRFCIKKYTRVNTISDRIFND